MIDIKPLFYWHDDGNGNAYRVLLDDPSQRDYCEHCQEVYSSAVVDALRARIAELECQIGAIPKGMVVVPKLPTKQMYEDGRDAVRIAIDAGDSPMAIASDAFDAMIAAAHAAMAPTPDNDR